jgi:phosphoglycerate dehydrogenase-like enzyme
MSVVVMFLSPARVEATRVPLPEEWQVRYLETDDKARILQVCADAEVILSVGSVAAIDAQIIGNCPKLKFIQCMGAGYNQVDLAAATKFNIPVANSPGQNAGSVAEYTIGSIIALQRRILESDGAIKNGRYDSFRKKLLHEGLQEIGGSRLGLVGLGNIGLQVAKIANLLGASVSYYTQRRRSAEMECRYGISYQLLDELLAGSDIVSLHIPLTASTKGLIGARELALMPAGSVLINTARGAVVDQVALAAALESGHLSGAAVDTFDPEPPDSEHPLLNLSATAQNRLLLTPHTAGVTAAAFRRMLAYSFENMQRALRGEPVENQVN